MSDDPLLAFATMASWGPAFPRIARWMETGLREIGAHADIVYLDRAPLGPSTAGPVRPRAARADVRTIDLGATHARSALPRLVHYFREHRPSMTLVTPGTIGCIAMIAGGLSARQVVPWEATVPQLDRADVPPRVRLTSRASTALYCRAPAVVAVSNGVRDALVADLAPRLDPGRVEVIPNPVDSDEIRHLAGGPASRSNRLRLCSIGRLVSAKGFDVLVDALTLARLGDAWELLVIGDGPLRAAIEKAVTRYGLASHVHLVGHIPNPYPLLASADVVVQPSRWEGFGIAVLEALALGIPVVATSSPGGVSDVLDAGRYGLLVPPDDPHALGRAISLVADDRSLRSRLEERGPGRAAEFAPPRVAAQVIDFARRAAQRAGG